MNIPPQNTSSNEDSVYAGPGITIIYDDRIAGLRAKHFSDMLVATLGCESETAPACWRSELVELPEIAEEISRDAAESEFVILSLRGDTSLSTAMKLWLESWLVGATGGPAMVVALFDTGRSAAAHAESTRYYLRHVTTGAGVAFFAHCIVAPQEWDIADLPEDEEPVVKPIRRRRSRDALAPIGSALRAGVKPLRNKQTHELTFAARALAAPETILVVGRYLELCEFD